MMLYKVRTMQQINAALISFGEQCYIVTLSALAISLMLEYQTTIC
jgi:hypothetical protein